MCMGFQGQSPVGLENTDKKKQFLRLPIANYDECV